MGSVPNRRTARGPAATRRATGSPLRRISISWPAATSRNNEESCVFASGTPTRTLGSVMNLVLVVPDPSTLTIRLVPLPGDHSSGAQLPVTPTPAVGRFVR